MKAPRSHFSPWGLGEEVKEILGPVEMYHNMIIIKKKQVKNKCEK